MSACRRWLWSAPVKGLCLFTLLGPPLGALLVMAVIFAADAAQGRGGALDAQTLYSGIALVLVFGYVLGVAPAAVAGFVAGLLRQRGHLVRVWHSLGVAAFAGLTATAYGVLLHLDSSLGPAFILFGVPGFVGGLICALVFRARGSDPEAD